MVINFDVLVGLYKTRCFDSSLRGRYVHTQCFRSTVAILAALPPTAEVCETFSTAKQQCYFIELFSGTA